MTSNINIYEIGESAVNRNRPLRVLLVYPDSLGKNTSPPLGMALIAAVLREKRCDVKIVDAAARRVLDGESKIKTAFERFNPDIVAIS